MARRVSPSVLSVEGPGGIARGFLFGSNRYLVAPLDVVEAGRGILVREANGHYKGAHIVVVDRQHGIALLETNSPLASAPLPVSDAVVERGTTVVSLGASTPGKSNAAVVIGIIARVSGDKFDATSRTPGHNNWGGPIVDCDGRVIGMAARPFGEETVNASVLSSLLKSAHEAPEYAPWTFAHFSSSLLVATAPIRPWVGLSIGTAIVGDDRYEFAFRANLLANAPLGDSYGTFKTALRVNVDTRFGYRFLLNDGFAPFYIVPTVGTVANVETGWLNSQTLTTQGSGCSTAAPCEVATKKSTGSRVWVAPVAGLAFRWGPGELGYSLQLDHFGPAVWTHTFNFGLQF